MGVVTSLFARKVINQVDQSIDRMPLFASVGLDPDAETDVKQMIADTVYYGMLEQIAALLEDATDFPLRVGASMHCDDYGAFGLAWKTAPTLLGSLERAERYARILTSVAEYEVRAEGSDAYFLLHRDGARRLGLRFSNEATLASAYSIMQEVSSEPFSPLAVHCKHPAPASTAAHEAHFGCPVFFGSDKDGLLISEADLNRRNKLGDDAISRFLTAHLDEEVAKRAAETSFEQVLLRRISDRLSEGPPRAGTVAREMGMSERTLHRRLSDEGLSFQSLLEKARLRLAEGLLIQSDHSIAEIAFLTGFSEQSAFTRAFKRWVDQTPAAFRDRKRG